MSMTINAAKLEPLEDGRTLVEPVFDFSAAHPEILAPDADDRAARGEDPFIPNPDHIPGTFMTLANGNARDFFEALGFTIDDEGFGVFDIDAVQEAVFRARNADGAPAGRPERIETGAGGATMIMCGLPEARIRDYLEGLAEMIRLGRTRGATHIAVA